MRALFTALVLSGCVSQASVDSRIDAESYARLETLALAHDTRAPDPTNAYADDPRAAALGHQLFFDPRFSGPLLEEDNNGDVGTLGSRSEPGRVSCAGCHVPDNGNFVDTRSTRGQLSLAAGWTRRRTPSLLDLSSVRFLAWDGRRDTPFSVVFGVIESPVEFNSSRLFVAQQIAALYREPYEAIFGPLPSLEAYATLAPSEAGCASLPSDPYTARCDKPGGDDDAVIRVVVNVGKALASYTRNLTCGPSRFDAWLAGDHDALSDDEVVGAALFVGRAGCIACHSGPQLTDQGFHNVGVPGGIVPFSGIDTSDDPGAAVGLAALRDDVLSSRGPYSDGDDGRLDTLADDLTTLTGAFRTPSLRCLEGRPSFMHNGHFRTLYDVVDHFIAGGSTRGVVGASEIAPLDLDPAERDQLVAFLRSLSGPGPDAALRNAPTLP